MSVDTMNATLSAQTVHDQISRDIDACNTLLSLLEDEQEALSSRDPDALANVIEKKAGPLGQLEQSAKQRAAWANVNDATKLGAAWGKVLEQLSQEKISKDWETLKRLTKECQQKNEVNGKILSRQQKVYGRLIELLRGQTQAPSLYGANGVATSSASSIKVDEA